MTTKRRKKRPLSSARLNNMVLLGTLLATGVGAQMLAMADQVPAIPAAPIIIEQLDGTQLIIDIAPMSELVIPEPVTNTRSSR